MCVETVNQRLILPLTQYISSFHEIVLLHFLLLFKLNTKHEAKDSES